MFFDSIPSPVGPLTVIVDARARLHYLLFEQTVDRRELARVARSRLLARDGVRTAVVANQIGEYFRGTRTTFELELVLAGTPFQRDVWRALSRLPYGTTCTYGHLAATLGRPRAARAVGAANGANPLSIIVPCHRLIGTNGSLTGYAGGINSKRWLIEFERGRDEAQPGY